MRIDLFISLLCETRVQPFEGLEHSTGPHRAGLTNASYLFDRGDLLVVEAHADRAGAAKRSWLTLLRAPAPSPLESREVGPPRRRARAIPGSRAGRCGLHLEPRFGVHAPGHGAVMQRMRFSVPGGQRPFERVGTI